MPDWHPLKRGIIGFVQKRSVSLESQSPVEKQIVTLKEQEDGIKMVRPRSNKVKYLLIGTLNAHSQTITTYCQYVLLGSYC
jgi:hypothetical protein